MRPGERTNAVVNLATNVKHQKPLIFDVFDEKKCELWYVKNAFEEKHAYLNLTQHTSDIASSSSQHLTS